jgi:hypothetical protein
MKTVETASKIIPFIVLITLAVLILPKRIQIHFQENAGLQQLDSLKSTDITSIELFEYSSKETSSEIPSHLLVKVTNPEDIKFFKAILGESRSHEWNHDTSQKAFKLKIVSKNSVVELNGMVTYFNPHDVWVGFGGNYACYSRI